MPKAKTSTKKVSSTSKKSKSKAPATAVEDVPAVTVEEVTLAEEAEEAEAPAPAPDAAADSSAEEATTETVDPFARAVQQVDLMLEFQKVAWAQFQQHHRETMENLKNMRKCVTALKSRKRKSTAKKGTNSNSGIVGLRNISDTMRTFLKADKDATYSYTTLCSALMNYGKEEKLVGLKTTNDAGEEKVDNRYMRLDSKLRKLFPQFDDVQAEVASEGKTTLLKTGKDRWINRAGVMKLIKPHLHAAIASASASADEADETAETSSA